MGMRLYKSIVAIFQPHTFSRTKNIYKDLCNVLNEVDASYILDIHPAREKQEDYPDITSDIIINNTKNCYHISDKDSKDLSKYNNTVFAFMSPNDLSILENDLIEKLKEAK
jgi:UDP-N-acetylmuramate--alanine ligase